MKDAHPPKWCVKFLRAICPDHLIEEIEGDLLQKFQRDVKTGGERKARKRFTWNVIRFFRPGIILRNKFSVEFKKGYMLQNYFKISYRHLMKSKVFSFINVAGLAVGIAAFWLIIQYVSFEMSFDQFHENKDEIYRVALEYYDNGELKNTSAKNYVEMEDILKEHLPEIKSYTGFIKIPANTGFLFSYNNRIFNEPGSLFQTDPDFFNVFPSLLARGDVKTVFDDPHNLVVSESMAKKIFGNSDPIGQHLGNLDENDNGKDFIVTGVLKDIPENSHFHANFIGVTNIDSWENHEPWRGFFYTYLTIPEETDDATIVGKLEKINKVLDKADPSTKGARVILQPVTDIHLHSHLNDELEASGNENLIYILYGIGLIILVTAWINYINIEAARFIRRSREVGIRRILGSSKGDLAMQFMVEYLMITVIALALAWILLQLILPQFSYLTGIPISRFQFSAPFIWLSALGLFIAGSLLVGIYPALFLIKLNPVSTLKGKITGAGHGRTTRKSLIAIQFTASIGLIAFLLVIFRQVNFMRLSNRKIELDKVISIRNPTAYMNQDEDEKFNDFKTLENKLLQDPSINAVATSSAIPGTEIGFTYVDLIKRNIGDPYDPTRYKTLFVDYGFIPVYGLRLKAGRNYSEQNGEDENWETLILNESAIRTLGFSSAEEAIGQEIQFMVVSEWSKYKIVGVVEDYHHEAIKKEIYPTIFFLNHNIGQQVYFSVKLNTGTNAQSAVASIEKSWKEIFPEKSFEYFFLDDYYDQQFKAEMHIGRIFSLFTGIAIFIACLGILGLTLFEANSRLKEISIRKVLGASASSLVALLSRGHIRMIVLSAFIAIPLIYFITKKWLSNYPVRIEISPSFFLAPLVVILVMVIVTSFYQTIKAANTNPVDHLKHE